MELKSLTYTSFATIDLDATDIREIHRVARETNALNSITGLLIFNGTHFLQVIEGPVPAIDELVTRLRQDKRHHHMQVRDERPVDQRQFPDWSMELVHVGSSYFEARDTLMRALPAELPDQVGSHILNMTEQISGPVNLPD